MDPESLRQMTAALRHRGPERSGIHQWTTGDCQISLGHTRLKILDLSDAASQPMGNDDGSVWLVFNGEIYNFRELRASLEQRGMRFRTGSDTEVLLRLYEVEGPRCVERLEGMFAFAVWDGGQRRLLLARDRVGKKPLFYCWSPTVFAFGSEIKALLRHPAIVPAVDRQSLPAFFLYGYVPTPDTIYQGIQQLPPGHTLVLDSAGQARLSPYWDLRPSGPSGPIPTPAHAAARVRDLLTAAVRRRLVSDVPVGAMLSGGLDSSIVVGIMSRLCREPVRTFSIGFSGDPRFDETAYARLAARRFGTRHTEFTVEPSAVELVERLVWHHDGPFADSSAIPTYLLCRLTREHVTVALNGDGGDELFAGYLRFYAAVLSERVPAWVPRAAHRMLGSLPPIGGPRGLVRRAQKFAASASLPFSERFSRWNAVFYEDLPALLPWSDTRQGNGRSAPEPLWRLEPYWSQCRGASGLSQLLFLNLKTYLLDDLLVKMDRCSMAHALEARSPFLDRELLEYVFGLPDEMKLRRGHTKVILRRAFADLVPREILTRDKMGFGVPLQRWFKTDLRDYLRDLLLAPGARLRGYVDQDYVRRLCEAHVAGAADYSARLWTLLTFEVWLRQLPTWSTAPEEAAVSAPGLG